MTQIWDTIIIGAGPAGLSAALYMARYRRSTLIIHDDTSLALRIPVTHNLPGCELEISGIQLISNMRSHALRYGARIIKARVTHVRENEGLFSVLSDDRQNRSARSVIFATGISLNEIALEAHAIETAVQSGVLRYCPICDGYEHIDQRIAVIGSDEHGASEALFLRQYSSQISLIPRNCSDLSEDQRKQLRGAGVTIIEAPVERYEFCDGEMRLYLSDGAGPLGFTVVYSALGMRPRTELPAALGVRLTERSGFPADAPFGTSIPGLYAAGDVVEGLDQISVAIGQGAISATRAHNWLRGQSEDLLEKYAEASAHQLSS